MDAAGESGEGGGRLGGERLGPRHERARSAEAGGARAEAGLEIQMMMATWSLRAGGSLRWSGFEPGSPAPIRAAAKHRRRRHGMCRREHR